MSVGFKLPPGTYSRMDHLPAPYVINEAGYPVPGKPDFIAQVQLRYGKPMDQWLPFDSAQGLHVSEFYGFLTTLATKDPGWFERNGFGKATGGTVPDWVEAHDAWYGRGAYEAVRDAAKALEAPVEPPTPTPPPVEPPTPPTPPPPPPPPPVNTALPTERMKETARMMPSWLPPDKVARRARLDELARWILDLPTRP